MSTKPSALSHIFSNLNDFFYFLGNHHNPEEWESNLRTIYASFFEINGETLAPQSEETKNLSILDQERESQFTAFFSLLIVLFMLLFLYIIKSCIWIYSSFIQGLALQILNLQNTLIFAVCLALLLVY
jgi:hypothetical protein